MKLTLDEYLALSEEQKNSLPEEEEDEYLDLLQHQRLLEYLVTPHMGWVTSLKCGDAIQDGRVISRIEDIHQQGILWDRELFMVDGSKVSAKYDCDIDPMDQPSVN